MEHFNIVALIVQVAGGALGGIGIGAAIKKIDLGIVLNAVLGAVGGGLGGTILNQIGISAMPSGATDIASIIGNVVSGGAGGGILMAIVGFVKTLIKK